eukprot:scaffold5560_cov444-Prasinococcus_capsulatus_cf.AAC.11
MVSRSNSLSNPEGSTQRLQQRLQEIQAPKSCVDSSPALRKAPSKSMNAMETRLAVAETAFVCLAYIKANISQYRSAGTLLAVGSLSCSSGASLRWSKK